MQDTLDILCYREYKSDDFVEHHGVKGMKWGYRKQKKQLAKLSKRTEKRAKGLENLSNRFLNNLKYKSQYNIKKYENKQYKLAKPYADSSGHFKITNPKKAQKHYLLSEKIISEKKLIKEYDEILKKRAKEVNKKHADTSMNYINNLMAHQAHQNAIQQHMNFMQQVQQQNTLQSIQNFHNQMNFDNMINMQNIHTHNMMF